MTEPFAESAEGTCAECRAKSPPPCALPSDVDDNEDDEDDIDADAAAADAGWPASAFSAERD